MDNDKLDGYDKSFQLLQNLHIQLLILFCLIWCKGMYHANTGPKGVWLPTEGNDHEARLTKGTCKSLPGKLPSPSIRQLEGDWR